MSYKIVPTVEELKTIQNMIYENESFNTISKSVNMSDKTIKRIIKDFNIDITKYNPRIAKGKKILKRLNNNQIAEIIEYLNNGVSLRKIKSLYGISHPTLVRILQDNGVNHEKYKRKSTKKFDLDHNQLNQVKIDINNGESITSISKKLSINRNTLSAYLKEVNVIKPTIVDNKMKQLILDMHKDYITISDIRIITNISIIDIKNIISQSDYKDISENMKYKNLSRHGFDKNKILLKYINKLSDINIVNEKDIDFCIKNMSKIPYIEIVKIISKDYKLLKKILFVLDHKDLFTFNYMMESEYKEELIQDLSTTAYSTVYLGMKYGVIPNTISQWRTHIFGDNIKSYYNTNLSKSNIEIEFELILNELDIAYISQYKIGKYKYDYYIGHKIIFELNGERFHNKDENDKYKIAEDLNNNIIVFTEKDFKNTNNIKKIVLDIYLKSIKKQYKL